MDIFGVRVAVLAPTGPECAALREALLACGIAGVRVSDTPARFFSHCLGGGTDLGVIGLGNAAASGFGALNALRAGQGGLNRYLPIIVALAHPTAQIVHEAINCGAHEFLVLPPNVRALSNLIYRAVFISRPFILTSDYSGPCRRRRANPDYKGSERRRAPWPGYVHASHKAQGKEHVG